MAQNIDLIEILSTAGGTCGCSASDFAGDFVAKTTGTYITSLSSAEQFLSTAASIWTPYTFTLGTTASTTEAVLTIQGVTNADAKIEVKGVATTTILPLSVTSTTLTAGGAMSLTNSAATLPAITTSGHLLPSGDDSLNLGASGTEWAHVYTDNLTVSGSTNLTDITLSGNLVVQGNTTLGNASGDAVTVTGTAVFTPEAEFNGGINCDGTLTMEANAISSTGAITTTGTVTGAEGTFTGATVSNTPTATTDVVRKTDVDIAADVTAAVAKVTVAGGFITDVIAGVAADLPDHATRHKSSELTGATPTSGGEDPLVASLLGATERATPVVKTPLRMTNVTGGINNYTYSAGVPYFEVIDYGTNPTQGPCDTCPEGQIIFRKANA